MDQGLESKVQPAFFAACAEHFICPQRGARQFTAPTLADVREQLPTACDP